MPNSAVVGRPYRIALILGLAGVGALGTRSGAAAEAPAQLLERAASTEAELVRHPAKLRHRDRIESLVALWSRARARAHGEERLQALAGEVRARHLLAHWSGRPEDADRAAEAEAELERAKSGGGAAAGSVQGEGAGAEHPVAGRGSGAAERASAGEPAAGRARGGAGEGTVPAILRAVRLDDGGDRLRLTLDLDGAPAVTRQRIGAVAGKGARVVFDLRPVRAERAALTTLHPEVPGLARVRVGQFDERTVRIVVEAQPGAALAPSVALEGSRPPAIALGPRPEGERQAAAAQASDERAESEAEAEALFASIAAIAPDEPVPERAGAEAGEEASASAASAGEARERGERPDAELEPGAELAIGADAAEGLATDEPGEVQAQLASLAVPARRGKARLAEDGSVHLKRSTRDALRPRDASLLRIRRVVIDAGHGGKDFGALGVHGLREKDVNLAIALKLGKELQQRLGVEVVYTRKTDRFVTLSRRARIANESNADLFVSVHANSHQQKSVSGIETYYLDTTSDRYAERLARRENTGNAGEGDDPEPGVGMPEHDGGRLPAGDLGRDVRLILADLAMRSASVESRRLAGYVQSTMVSVLRRKKAEVHDLGVKHALFYVLLGARMPAVLIETGFVTCPGDARRLADPNYASSAATAIAQGIGRFAAERETLLRRLSAGASRPDVRRADLERPLHAALRGD